MKKNDCNYRKAVLMVLLMSLPLVMATAGASVVSHEVNTASSPLDKAVCNVTYLFNYKIWKDGRLVSRTDTMVLSAGSQWSVYYDLNAKSRGNKINSSDRYWHKTVSFDGDSARVRTNLNLKMPVYCMTDYSYGEPSYLYKDRDSGRLVTIEPYGTRTQYRVKESVTPQWTLSKESKTILNHKCHKATTAFRGRTFTVWYADDIAIKDGPWKLFGLPGMILQAEDSEHQFSFLAENVSNGKEEPIRLMPVTSSGYVDMDAKTYIKGRAERKSVVSYGFVESDGCLHIHRTSNHYTIIPMELYQ
jgi:GLPGLI family protein